MIVLAMTAISGVNGREMYSFIIVMVSTKSSAGWRIEILLKNDLSIRHVVMVKLLLA